MPSIKYASLINSFVSTEGAGGIMTNYVYYTFFVVYNNGVRGIREGRADQIRDLLPYIKTPIDEIEELKQVVKTIGKPETIGELDRKYNMAKEKMAVGAYLEAEGIFYFLGDFRDSKEMANIAWREQEKLREKKRAEEKRLAEERRLALEKEKERQRAEEEKRRIEEERLRELERKEEEAHRGDELYPAYREAKQLMKSEKYGLAKEKFLSLGDYEDAPVKAAEAAEKEKILPEYERKKILEAIKNYRTSKEIYQYLRDLHCMDANSSIIERAKAIVADDIELENQYGPMAEQTIPQIEFLFKEEQD